MILENRRIITRLGRDNDDESSVSYTRFGGFGDMSKNSKNQDDDIRALIPSM